jgi:hypothetical protein
VLFYVVATAVFPPSQGHFMNHDNITDIATYLRLCAALHRRR